MLLSTLLDPSSIHLHSDMRGKNQVIDHLLRHFLKKAPAAFDYQTVARAVADREALGGTAFPTGIAVPHARLESFSDLLIGICVPRSPIEMEGIPIRMVILILTSRVASNTYLNTLASFMKISQNEELFGRLLAARSPHDFVAQIERSGLTVKKRFTVADAMNAEVPTVSPDAPVREIADLLYAKNASYVAVVDSAGLLLGEVCVLDLLELGLPHYATMLEGLGFVESLAPLEVLAEKEDTLLVREVMKKPAGALAPGTAIAEAVFELVRSRRHVLPVVDAGRIVGTLGSLDILRRIVRE